MEVLKSVQVAENLVLSAEYRPMNNWAVYQVVFENKKKNYRKVVWSGGVNEKDECYAKFGDFLYLFD